MARPRTRWFGVVSGARRSLAWLTMVAFFAAMFVLPAPAEAQYGRTEGGYAGGLLGATGGAALGTALVGAAGIASPLLASTIVVASSLGTGFAGARLGSKAGHKWIDDKFDAKNVWTVVGGVTGALAGIALGPAGSLAGKFLGAAAGAALGAFLGRKVADTANEDFNPRTVGALIGGLNGLMIGGPLGAVAGTTLGYIGGKVLDKHIFWDPDGDDDRASEDSDDDEDEDERADSGFDRQGYDAMGYDDDGYDREGFDRKGYDRDGVDRRGYDEDGFRVRDPASSQGEAFEFDRDLYNAFWSWYSVHGGKYPDFVDSHWDYFPSKDSRAQRIKHVAYYQRRIEEVLGRGDAEMRDLEQEWKRAVRKVKDLAASGASTARQREALEDLYAVEKDLRDAVRDVIEDE